MRIFVTGGAGFIGSNFIRYVLGNHPDVQVTNFDALTYAGNLESLKDLADSPAYNFVQGDIRDPHAVLDAMKGHDAVVNFAAESHVDRSIDGPREFLETNMTGAGSVFEAGRQLEVEHFLHISTDEVYGSIDVGSFREGDALEPNSPYSASKAGADLLARAYRVTYDYPIKVTRTGNNFGPYHFPEKMIPLFVTNLMAGKKVPLYGDGGNIRDWTYVVNNAAAQFLVLTEGEPGGVYNVADDNEMSNKTLTYKLLDAFGLGEEMIEFVKDRPGHDLRYSIDTTKIQELGWKPEVAFEDALARTIQWYRDNEWWWRPLRETGASDRRGGVTK